MGRWPNQSAEGPSFKVSLQSDCDGQKAPRETEPTQHISRRLLAHQDSSVLTGAEQEHLNRSPDYRSGVQRVISGVETYRRCLHIQSISWLRGFGTLQVVRIHNSLPNTVFITLQVTLPQWVKNGIQWLRSQSWEIKYSVCVAHISPPCWTVWVSWGLSVLVNHSHSRTPDTKIKK